MARVNAVAAEWEQNLALAIVVQAINDYRELEKREVNSVRTRREGTYSKREIEDFFESNWCDTLLGEISENYTADEVYRCITEKAS